MSSLQEEKEDSVQESSEEFSDNAEKILMLKDCFSAWSDLVPQLKEENKESEAAYNDIIERFRFVRKFLIKEKSLNFVIDCVD